MDAWPAERVATQPPTVEYSNDCGAWPSVTPSAARRRSASGPSRPAASVAVWERRSTVTPVSRRRSSAITPAKPSLTGSTPPTTLVPPPNGTTAIRASAQAASTASNLPVGGGLDDQIRCARGVARAQPHEVGVALAGGVLDPRQAVVAHVIGSHRARQALARARRQARLGEPDGLERDRAQPQRGIDTELVAQELERCARQGDLVPLLPPAPPPHGSPGSPKIASRPSIAPCT